MRVLGRVAGKTRHQPLDNVSDEHVLRMLGCNSTDADIRQRMLIATSAAMSHTLPNGVRTNVFEIEVP